MAEAAVLAHHARASSKVSSAWTNSSAQPVQGSAKEPFSVAHGVAIKQNGRSALEDAFTHAMLGTGGLSTAAGVQDMHTLSTSSSGPGEPLVFFGVYDGHGGAEVAQHAAGKLHQHFQAAYQQLAHSAALAKHGSCASVCSDGSTSSGSSSGTALGGLLSDTWASNSSTLTDAVRGSEGEEAAAGAAACCFDASLDALLSPLSPVADLSASQAAAVASASCSSLLDPPGSSSSMGIAQATGGRFRSTAPSGAVAAAAAALGGTCSGLRHLQHHHAAQGGVPGLHSQCVVRSLREAFLRTDAELQGTEVGELVGTTAVVAVVGREELYVGHCGDSRAVLCRKGTAIPLTNDHKPGRSDELARVASLGGKVVYKAGSHRIMGLLAMSRALGDHFLRPYVIPEPEVLCLQRTPEDELLLLATDGLWDVFSCQEATTLALRSTIRARQRGASPAAACRVGASVLVRGAIERGSRDNITVAVVDLRAKEESISSVASVLVSQCSGLPFFLAQNSRKRRSSTGDDDDEVFVDCNGCSPSTTPTGAQHSRQQEMGPLQQTPQPHMPHHHHHHHRSSSGASSTSSCTSSHGTAAAATSPVAVYARRHTSSNCDGGDGGGSAAGCSGGRSGSGSGWTWAWSLHGPKLLQQQDEEQPGARIIGLARAAAAAVAAFSGSGGSGSISRTVSQAAAASSAAVPVPQQAAPVPSDFLSMHSAPATRFAHSHAGVPGRSSKPPLPRPRAT